jgi:hypothetical protein
MLNSEIARQFYQVFIFWDAKRPITVKILERLNILALARELGRLGDLVVLNPKVTQPKQLALWETA